MIALALFSLGVAGYRLYRRQMSRGEVALLALALTSVSMIIAQSAVASHRFPEMRYWNQATAMLYPWGIWGIMGAWRVRRVPVKVVLAVIFGLFACVDLGMLAKRFVPGTRRNAYVAACDWAVEKIKADWKGPARDMDFVPAMRNYSTPFRPCVDAYTRRIPYLVGGRRWSKSINSSERIDPYDYWVQDMRRPGFPVETNACEKMGTFVRGKYRFELWKRK